MRGLIIAMIAGTAVLYMFIGLLAAVAIEMVAKENDIKFFKFVRYMYTNYGKFRKKLIIYVAGLIAWVLIGTVYIGAANKNDEEYIYHIVQSGESVWSIAYDTYGDEVDLRKMVRKIERMNGIKQSVIYPGQIIEMPDGGKVK